MTSGSGGVNRMAAAATADAATATDPPTRMIPGTKLLGVVEVVVVTGGTSGVKGGQ